MSFYPTPPIPEPELVTPQGYEPAPAPIQRRIPNLGHAAIFISFAAVIFLSSQLVLALLGISPVSVLKGVVKLIYPKTQLAVMAFTYLVTLAAAWVTYPRIWRRTFLDGLRWNWFIARRQAGQLIALGLVLGFLMQIVTWFITPPKSMPIDEFFLTPATAWAITLFGTIIAPVFEEITFRGFLVPAFAIAYDWLSLPRTDEARLRWRTSTTLTPASLVFSGVVTSLFFALLHAQQVAHLFAALTALFSVSLVLTFVRIRMHSVAASTLVHASYNSFIFITMLIATGGYRHLDRLAR